LVSINGAGDDQRRIAIRGNVKRLIPPVLATTVSVFGVSTVPAQEGTAPPPAAAADPRYGEFDFWPAAERWRQVRVSNYMAIDYAGGLTADGSMELVGEITCFHNENTLRFLGRRTRREDGTVRRYFAHFDEEKGAMVPVITGIYHRKPWSVRKLRRFRDRLKPEFSGEKERRPGGRLSSRDTGVSLNPSCNRYARTRTSPESDAGFRQSCSGRS
jgi:hypothetical protein